MEPRSLIPINKWLVQRKKQQSESESGFPKAVFHVQQIITRIMGKTQDWKSDTDPLMVQ